MGPGEVSRDVIDIALIAAVKRSPQYRAVRARVAKVCPSDTWEDDRVAFVVFDLETRADSALGTDEGPAKAVFALAIDSGALLAARVVEGVGQGATVANLLEPTGTQAKGAVLHSPE